MSGHVIIYGLGSAAVAALNFVLFAIYARHLRPEDYGAMSLIVTVCAAVSMVGLLGMNNAVQRFFFDAKDEAGKRRIWGSGVVGSLALTTALALVTAGGLQLFGRIQPAFAGTAALLALATVLPQALLTWLQDFARLQFQPWRFALLGLGQAVVAGAAGLVFVVHFDFGLAGFFGGALVAALATALVAVVMARGAWPLTFAREEFIRLVRFGAPFVPAGVFIWASSAVLRWQLAHDRGLEEAGLFEVAWKLSAPVWMLNAAIGQAFGPYAIRRRAEVPE
jgi:O-antigen/teichoic acid export membrane protein